MIDFYAIYDRQSNLIRGYELPRYSSSTLSAQSEDISLKRKRKICLYFAVNGNYFPKIKRKMNERFKE